MERLSEIEPVFVEFIPENPEHGKLYISEKFRTATHLCACGCGNKVVTPLKDGFWWWMKDAGGKVIIRPSIGSWNLPCKSHYHITHNRIEWLSEEEARQCDITTVSANPARERETSTA